ncbi:hypothetical protein [Streptomyces sp. NRRL S-118]|uniref:hypothetical protein n=1 Tax=Streptomyces sp. NRRL S-118 TaxID=1463881 RepID=UPI0004CB501A|nr:hypothetical protein [Streptomyces sp. NRRL S-118]
MRVTTTVLAAVLTVAVAGGSAVAHATAADAEQAGATGAHITAPRPAATVVAHPASTAAAETRAGDAVDTVRSATAHRAEAGAQTLRREGPYPNPEIATGAAQLTIALGLATGYYLVQVWDTVRQTTNWWINYT